MVLLKRQIAMNHWMEGKIPSTSGLATNPALTAVENKKPNISSLVKKNSI